MVGAWSSSKGVGVNRFSALLEREIPIIAVTFRDNDSEKLAPEAKAAGVDVAELRIDRFSSIDPVHVVNEVRKFHALPVLATIRSQTDGGDWSGTETERLDLFRVIMPEVDAVDIELSSAQIRTDVIAAARAHQRVVIVSHHDFETTPALDILESIVHEAKDVGADIVKISTMARSKSDLRTLASLAIKMADLGLIVIAMGAVGTVGRVLFPALGSCLTFSFIGDRPAPGQLTFDETFHLMRKFYPEFNEQKIISMQLLEDV